MIRRLRLLVIPLLMVGLIPLGQVNAQEIGDIIGDVIEDSEGNPLAKACDEGGQDSSFCNQIKSDQGGLVTCNNVNNPGAEDGLVADNASDCNDNLILRIVKIALQLITAVSAGLSVIFIILGGIKYSASGGIIGKEGATGLKQAKSMITYALVGLVLTIFAGSIVGLFLTGI